MNKTITGFDVNVDNEVQELHKKYPRFESVNAGYWLYGKPSALLKDVFEHRKTSLYFISNIMTAISTIETLLSINEDYIKEGIDYEKSKVANVSHNTALTQLGIDLQEHRVNYAKSFVFEHLLKMKIMEG